MRAAFCQPGPVSKERRACFELRKIPKPTLEDLPPGSLLLRIVACSICGTDLFGKNQATGRQAIAYLDHFMPICGGSGHELLGEVVEVVEPCEKKFPVGQLVLAMSPAYIRRMKDLGTLFEQKNNTKPTILPDLGGFTEYTVSHECCCLPVPDDSHVSTPLHYCAAQPLGTILHACRKLDSSLLGKNVAIVGQGPNGLIMTQMLANMGARRVITLDLIHERLEVSRKCKATHTIQVTEPKSIDPYKAQIKEITNGEMCDVVVEMVGHQSHTINLCAELTKDGGTVLLFGLLSPEGSGIQARDFVRSLKYVCSSSPNFEDFELAMELIAQGRFDPEPLFSHTVPFSTFPETYAAASEYKDGIVKVLFTYEGEDE